MTSNLLEYFKFSPLGSGTKCDKFNQQHLENCMQELCTGLSLAKLLITYCSSSDFKSQK